MLATNYDQVNGLDVEALSQARADIRVLRQDYPLTSHIFAHRLRATVIAPRAHGAPFPLSTIVSHLTSGNAPQLRVLRLPGFQMDTSDAARGHLTQLVEFCVRRDIEIEVRYALCSSHARSLNSSSCTMHTVRHERERGELTASTTLA